MNKSTPFLFMVCILQFAICNLQPVTSFAQYTKLLDFAGAANGRLPNGSLISDGTFLYGTTEQGGTNDKGTIFKIKPDGTGYARLLDFTGTANGSIPPCSLLFDGNFLYGVTWQGGTSNFGVIFKIKPDGTGYAKLLDFTGTANGSNPYGSLVSDGTFLYGMTIQGGINDRGTIFKIKPDGTGFSKLLDFTGTDGSNPYGSLISDGTFLYGMTTYGGINNNGTIFKIKPDGTGFSKLLDFTGTANGSTPYSSLISDGIFLYGMTTYGGTGTCNTTGCGTIFKIKPDGTGYAKLLDFTGTPDGHEPWGSFISDGTFLYGMAQYGGINNGGTIFKIKHDGTGYSRMFDFLATDGLWPSSSLLSDGTFLYGMTYWGGTNNMGVIFKYQYNTAPPCTASITGNSTICAGQNTTLTASGGTTYLWNTMETTASITVSPSANTTYTVTAATGTCLATATVTVTVNPLSTVSISGNASICLGDCDTLIASGGLVYSWNPGGQTTYAIVVCPTAGATYTVTAANANGCTNTAAVTIAVLSPPATPAITVNMSTLASSSATGNQWYLNGTPISGAVSQFYTASQNGFYTVCVTDANGCSSCSAPYNFSTTGIAKNDISNEVSVYPNPSNGKFQITSYKFQTTDFEIYNIMGEKVTRFKLLPQGGGTNSLPSEGSGRVLDLSPQPDGIYFIRVKSEGRSFAQKIIIQK